MTQRNMSAVVELAAAQHGVFNRAQAADLGIDRKHLGVMARRGMLDEPLPTVLRVRGAPETWHQQVMAGCLAYRATASHRSATRLHGLGDRWDAPVVEGLVTRGFQRDAEAMILHRAKVLDQRDITIVDGIPVTSIARTLCDLGAVASMDQVEQALDEALRKGVSLRWIEDTLTRLDRPGPSGTGKLRRVLALPDRQGSVAGSWRERVAERLLVHPELQPMVRQFTVVGADGRVIARPDLAIVEIGLGIEYHSDQWHYGPRRGRGDRRRDLAAAGVGWELIYLDQADFRDDQDLVESVVRVARSRRALPRFG